MSSLRHAVLVTAIVVVGCGPADAPMVATAERPNYLSGYPALAREGVINVVVEIPAGTNEKWQVTKDGAGIEWELEAGRPRTIEYLAYPANYGIVPATLLPRDRGGDGDPLDVVLLGPAVERGSVVPARPIGVLRLLDDGERDDKVLAVPLSGPLSGVHDLAELEADYPGAAEIVALWFTSYKGPGRLESTGFAEAEEALATVLEASTYFREESSRGDNEQK